MGQIWLECGGITLTPRSSTHLPMKIPPLALVFSPWDLPYLSTLFSDVPTSQPPHGSSQRAWKTQARGLFHSGIFFPVCPFCHRSQSPDSLRSDSNAFLSWKPFRSNHTIPHQEIISPSSLNYYLFYVVAMVFDGLDEQESIMVMRVLHILTASVSNLGCNIVHWVCGMLALQNWIKEWEDCRIPYSCI